MKVKLMSHPDPRGLNIYRTRYICTIEIIYPRDSASQETEESSRPMWLEQIPHALYLHHRDHISRDSVSQETDESSRPTWLEQIPHALYLHHRDHII
jgi:hypothetical protein